LGEIVGLHAIALVDDARTPMVALTEEVVSRPETFALLNDLDVRRRFLHSVLHGLADAARQFASLTFLAPDYGRWTLTIWRVLRALAPKPSLPHEALLSAMHWLSRHGRRQTNDPVALRHWWSAIHPLLLAAIREGTPRDPEEVFRQLRDDDYAAVMSGEDLFTLVEALGERLSTLAEAPPAGDSEHRHLRQAADYAARGIDAAHRRGQLKAPALSERAYDLLDSLARSPVPSRVAATVVQRIQHETV
jgi:hypothetical protein